MYAIRSYYEGQGNREAAAQDANRILDEEISRYLNMERAKQVAPLITALRENANSVRSVITSYSIHYTKLYDARYSGRYLGRQTTSTSVMRCDTLPPACLTPGAVSSFRKWIRNNFV